jgi:hypothetical protein
MSVCPKGGGGEGGGVSTEPSCMLNCGSVPSTHTTCLSPLLHPAICLPVSHLVYAQLGGSEPELLHAAAKAAAAYGYDESNLNYGCTSTHTTCLCLLPCVHPLHPLHTNYSWAAVNRSCCTQQPRQQQLMATTSSI